jgi:class 3 adenylate cyclase/tetratricopeptide (TPR) repeat protein
MQCPECQHENRPAAKFCENCGVKLQLLCPNCGSEHRAGATFCDKCGHKLTDGGEAVDSIGSPVAQFIPPELLAKLESAHANQAMEGERRIVTMLFCDVKGSTAAAEQLDPEEWAEIMNGAFEHMIKPIYTYEGTVARLMGDAILAFFGAPIAHEDDPQRAVLAGLGIVSSMAPYRERVRQQWGIDFDVRVGINTGLVVVGAMGSDLRMEYTAMGDAINLAARMEQTAAPGSVRIAQDTYRLVSPLFTIEALGGVQVKGRDEPVLAYRVLGRKSSPGRVRGIEGLDAPLIGRHEEQRALATAFASLEKGVGGIVYLLGEAGLGKSRLIREFRIRAQGRQPTTQWYETHSLSYESEQPYSLFRRLMRRVVGALPDEKPEAIRSKLMALVGELPAEERANGQRVLESLFGLGSASAEPPVEGETFKGLLYNVIAALSAGRAEEGAVVVVFDDLHWSDPASLGLLQHLYPLTDRVPMLLVCAMRPAREARAWSAKQAAEVDFPHRYQEILLQPLEAAQSGELLDSLLNISDLPVGLRQHVLEKSEGNPLFVEEVVRSLIDKGVVVREAEGMRWRATSGGDDLEIPDNLQTLLIARIDGLAAAARRTLQLAAVVGRSFYHQVLQRIVDMGGELDQQLLTLQQAQLILEAARLPEREYIFRHALTQEAAYNTILLKQRREFHERVGEALESLYPARREEMAGTLANHFFQGGAFEKALHYFTQAGDAAFRLHAVSEARAYYEQALACAEKVDIASQQLIHLYLRCGRACELDSQFEAALQNYRVMAAAADERMDEALQLASLTAQCILRATQTPLYDPRRARLLAEQALALARELGDRAAEARVLWGMLLVEAWGDGDSQKGLQYGLRSLGIARELGLKEQMGFTYTNLVNVYWSLGRLEAAREAIQQAREIWAELGNLPMSADANTMKQYADLIAGEFEAVLSAAGEGLRLSRSIGNSWNHMTALHFMAWVYTEQGEVGRAHQALERNRALVEEVGLFKTAGPTDQLAFYLSIGALDRAEPLAEGLYRQRERIIPFLRPRSVALIIMDRIARGALDQAERILQEQYKKSNLDESPFLYAGYLALAEIHLSLARGNPLDALERGRYLVDTARSIGFRYILPEALWLYGKANMALDRPHKAHPILLEALGISKGMGERRIRWRILGALSEVAVELGDENEAISYRDAAREIALYLAEHAGRADLRAAFLAWPEVQALLKEEPAG